MTQLKNKIDSIKNTYRLELEACIDVTGTLSFTPVSFAVHGDRLLFVNRDKKSIAIVEVNGFNVKEEPRLEMINPFGIYVFDNTLYVCDRGDSSVKLFDLNSFQMCHSFPLKDYPPALIDVEKDGVLYGLGWNPGKIGGEVWKIEKNKMSTVFRKDEDFLPRNIWLDEPYLYISFVRNKSLLKIDTRDSKISEERPLYKDISEPTAFAGTANGELIGITSDDDIVKFTTSGEVCYIHRTLIPKVQAGGKFLFFHYVEDRLYAYESKYGNLYILKV